MLNLPQLNVTVENMIQCYNILGEYGETEDDYPYDIQILESEGRRVVEGLGISSNNFLNLLKTMKVNIGSHENPKFANIGDYWEDETIRKIINLLH